MTLLVLPFLLGLLLACIAWPRRAGGEKLLVASLGLGLGLGLVSLVFSVSLVLAGSITHAFVLAEIALLVVLGRIFLSVQKLKEGGEPRESETVPRAVALGAALALLLATASYGADLVEKPNGGWDAWMIYNMRARFLWRGGEEWRDAFSPLLERNYFHADYPLLLPSLVARGWACAGGETALVPALVATLFSFGAIALVGAAVAATRGRTHGLLAAVALACTPDFLHYGSSECCDVPVGFFLLAALALFSLEDRERTPTRGFPFLAGISLGLGAWTKNEGCLFVVAVLAARLFSLRKDGFSRVSREVAWIAAGLAAPLACLVWFKLALAPANDLVAGQSGHALAERLSEPHRYAYIVKKALKESYIVEHWGTSAPPVLAAFVFLSGFSGKRDGKSVATAWLALGLISAGFFLVYLTTPHGVEYHVDTSLRRLLTQLCPAWVYAVFLVAAPAQPTPARPTIEPGQAA